MNDNNYFGIINIYKEKGYTSHDVVAILRKKLRTKKIGHTGTLDPDAEGVLPICIGKATKAVEYLIEKNKVYRTRFLLGITTDTQDISGAVIKEFSVEIDEERILQVINSYVGEYNQIPPMYSALKVNGKKLYELAREGKTVEREPRKIFIDSISNIKIEGHHVEMEVSCSKGTYIRTLCHDIGEDLGFGAAMTDLIRIKSGEFMLDTAIKLEEIDGLIEESKINNYIYPVEKIFSQYDKVIVKKDYNKFLYNGNKLLIEHLLGEPNINLADYYRIYDENGSFIGLYRCIEKHDIICLKPEKIFL